MVEEYRFSESRRVFAKLYPEPEAGRDVYRIHDELCKHGSGPARSTASRSGVPMLWAHPSKLMPIIRPEGAHLTPTPPIEASGLGNDNSGRLRHRSDP
jgi:hypothetical protein